MRNLYDDESFADLPKADRVPIEIDDVISRLADQQTHLSRHLDRRWDDLDARRLVRLLLTYGQNASRLGRLLRVRCLLYGQANEGLEDLLHRAGDFLDEPPSDDDDDGPFVLPPVDIDDVITDLADKQERLAGHLDRLWSDPDAQDMDRLLAVYSQNASRLGRLLRDRCTVYGQPRDPFDVLMDQALDEVWRRIREGELYASHPSPPDP
jgi:hypothetical protein